MDEQVTYGAVSQGSMLKTLQKELEGAELALRSACAASTDPNVRGAHARWATLFATVKVLRGEK